MLKDILASESIPYCTAGICEKKKAAANAEWSSCYLYQSYLLCYDSPPRYRQRPQTSSGQQTLSVEQEARPSVVGWWPGVPQRHQVTLDPQAARRAAQLPICPESDGEKFEGDKIIKNIFNRMNYNCVSLVTSPNGNKQQNNTNNWQQV
jgi:hypothetical protein